MKFIKQFFIKRAIKASDSTKVRALNPKYKWKILYDASTDSYVNDLSDELQKTFNCDREDIVELGVSENVGNTTFISYDSFSWLGDLNDDAVNEALLAPCEHLIIFTENAGTLIRYLDVKLQSNIQIGLPDENLDLNLTINISAEKTSIFVRELKHYLAKIKIENEAI